MLPKLDKKNQPEYCFCPDTNDHPFTVCFDSKTKRFSAWQSKYFPSLLIFKYPFNAGTWEYGENEIIQKFSDGNTLNVVPLNNHYPFPPFIKMGESILNPGNCEKTEMESLSKKNKGLDYGIYCPLKSKEPSMFLNFKEKTYKSWAEGLLRYKESIFFEKPTFEGIFEIEKEQILFSTSELKKEGKVLSWEIQNVIPKQFQFFLDDNQSVIFEKDKCSWSEDSLESLPILNEGKIFCENTEKDLIIWLKPDKTLDFYRETKEFSPDDFLKDKFFHQGTDVHVGKEDISYYFNKIKITGKVKRAGEEIVWIYFPQQGNMKRSYEYSQEFCPSFFLKKDLLKK